jgi:hypothetical protein
MPTGVGLIVEGDGAMGRVRPRRAEPRTLTKDDWRALYTLFFGIGKTICLEGVDALPPKLKELLLRRAPASPPGGSTETEVKDG